MRPCNNESHNGSQQVIRLARNVMAFCKSYRAILALYISVISIMAAIECNRPLASQGGAGEPFRPQGSQSFAGLPARSPSFPLFFTTAGTGEPLELNLGFGFVLTPGGLGVSALVLGFAQMYWCGAREDCRVLYWFCILEYRFVLTERSSGLMSPSIASRYSRISSSHSRQS